MTPHQLKTNCLLALALAYVITATSLALGQRLNLNWPYANGYYSSAPVYYSSLPVPTYSAPPPAVLVYSAGPANWSPHFGQPSRPSHNSATPGWTSSSYRNRWASTGPFGRPAAGAVAGSSSLRRPATAARPASAVTISRVNASSSAAEHWADDDVTSSAATTRVTANVTSSTPVAPNNVSSVALPVSAGQPTSLPTSSPTSSPAPRVEPTASPAPVAEPVNPVAPVSEATSTASAPSTEAPLDASSSTLSTSR